MAFGGISMAFWRITMAFGGITMVFGGITVVFGKKSDVLRMIRNLNLAKMRVFFQLKIKIYYEYSISVYEYSINWHAYSFCNFSPFWYSIFDFSFRNLIIIKTKNK
jgi:hypothetical protein